MTIVNDVAIHRYGKDLGEYSIFFRNFSERTDAEPDEILKYTDHPAIKLLSTLRTLDAEKFFSYYEALSYGDVGVLFASPRTCLSGILLQFIGSEEHQDFYFNYLKDHKIRSFFAATEPNYGSDLSKIETFFDKAKSDESIYIHGNKILVGNMGVATMGVLIGRVSHNPLGICAALVKPEDFLTNRDKVTRATLPLFGIKPSLLGEATFSNFAIPKSQMIGTHLSPIERGLQAIIKTFNIMRLGISGLALGHAQAVVDYIQSQRINLSKHEYFEVTQWQSDIDTIRYLALDAAKKNKIDRLDTSYISLVKSRASNLAERISTGAVAYFGTSCFAEHPFILKSVRDCFGFEYMDGTTNIQRKNIYQGYVGGKLEVSFA